MKSGIYVLQYTDDCIKIGRSADLEQRLKQYRGYQPMANEVRRLLVVKCEDHKGMEKVAHEYAQNTLSRLGRYEVFRCANPSKFAADLLAYLRTYHNVDARHVLLAEPKVPEPPNSRTVHTSATQSAA
jgi:hypothetical protein